MGVRAKTHWSIYISLVILLVGVVALAVAQVFTANSATKLESSLFNILQFLFSLLFALLLSRILTEQQFFESQRKFAIGAFRRIKEIERSLTRTFTYVLKADNATRGIPLPELTGIRVGLMSTQDAVRSSIADWSDIIGDEIEVANEIERLKRSKIENDIELDYVGVNQATSASALEGKIAELKNELPQELRISVGDEPEDGVEKALKFLRSEIKEHEKLNLAAFWDAKDSFNKDAAHIKVGDTVYIAYGLTKNRNASMLVYDQDGNWIAVVTNLCADIGCDYDDFFEALAKLYHQSLLPRSFGGTPLQATVTETEELDEKLKRQYFYIQIEKPKYSARKSKKK